MNRHPKRGKLLAVLLFLWVVRVIGQTAADEIKPLIEKVEKGQTTEVKQELPRLVAKYQNEPGILYLQGRLASDGIEAVKFYQSIVDNFPKSEWADDALYRIYQYYYALGLYRTAGLKMEQLKQDYPNSPFAMEMAKQKLPVQDEVAVHLPPKEPVTSLPPTPEVRRETVVATPKAPEIKTAEAVEPYTLQVGAFSSVTNAEKQKSFFEDLGFSVEVTNKVTNGRSLYKVWVGNYKNPDEAKRIGKQVKTKYKIDSIVVERY